jgi:predicted helicase
MSYQSLQARMLQIFNKSTDNEELKLLFKLDSQAGKKLLENRDKVDFEKTLLRFYSYRVFDTRYFYSENKFLWRSVEKLQQQFSKENIAIVTTKSLSTNLFRHIFITENVGDYSFISDKTREVNYYFPLHLYNTSPYIQKERETNLSYKNLMIFDKPKEKESNIKAEIIEKLSKQHKKKIDPEEIFYYIYGILYSNNYREKYQEFLKIDFPKIPFTNDYKLFQKAAKLGKELIDLHLLKSDKLKKSIAKFPKTGDSRVEKREYNEKEKRIYINGKQYFENVKPEIWNYHIGGYQVLDKWLKDRIGKILSAEDVNHYLKIISTLKYTMDLQKQIDEIYSTIEKDLIEK